MKTSKLITAYREAAIRNHSAGMEGNAKKANRAYDRLVKLSHEVRTGGPEVQRAFLVLLEDEEPAVRGSAAMRALEFAPEKGLPVLQELAAKGPWPINEYVQWFLDAWQKGTLPHR